MFLTFVIKLPHPLLSVSQSECLIQLLIQIFILNDKLQILKKLTDLDLHCMQRQSLSRSSKIDSLKGVFITLTYISLVTDVLFFTSMLAFNFSLLYLL